MARVGWQDHLDVNGGSGFEGQDFGEWLEALRSPGGLSIIVQGALFDHNIVETANHCAHWRSLFPGAEIICSISVTDLVEGTFREDGSFADIRLAQGFRSNGVFQAALHTIVSASDVIALGGPATALPPVKQDVGPNNGNLQIQAARRGLGLATGMYVLRVRSDLVFLSDRFLRFFWERARLARGTTAFLSERVLISQLFTLNPYTLERMPFHYSDWFHFGLLKDVVALWPPVAFSFADSCYHAVNPHPAHSNALEKKFLARLAVEQFLMVSAMSAAGDEIELSWFNDTGHADRSMRVLLDNFVIADMSGCAVYFPKYSRSVNDPHMKLLCVSAEDWSELAELSDTANFAAFYADKRRASRRYLVLNHESSMKMIRIFTRAGSRAEQAVRAYLRSVSRIARSLVSGAGPFRRD